MSSVSSQQRAALVKTTTHDFDHSLMPTKTWTQWGACLGVRQKMLETDISRVCSVLWDENKKVKPEKNVLGYAKRKDENVVAFALICVEDHHSLMNVRDERRSTLLHVLAATNCSAALFRMAVAKNPRCANACDSYGNTPYHVAAAKGYYGLLRLLTFDLTPREILGSPHYTVPNHTLPGTGVVERNEEGWTPLHLAVDGPSSLGQMECVAVIAELTNYSLDQRRGGDGYTALHIAVLLANDICARQLLTLGASPDVRSCLGLSALDLARIVYGEDASVSVLCKRFSTEE